jgi:hypothetical protein
VRTIRRCAHPDHRVAAGAPLVDRRDARLGRDATAHLRRPAPASLLVLWHAAVSPSLLRSMHQCAGGISPTRGALLLSCMRASVAELTRQTLATDEHQARRAGLSSRLLRQGEAGVGARSIRALGRSPVAGASSSPVETPLSKEQSCLSPRRVSAAAQIRPFRQRADGRTGAPGLLLCREAGASACVPARRPL